MKPSTTRRSGVVIELHGATIKCAFSGKSFARPRASPLLGAARALDEPLTASPYIKVLQLVDRFRPNRHQNADAKAPA